MVGVLNLFNIIPEKQDLYDDYFQQVRHLLRPLGVFKAAYLRLRTPFLDKFLHGVSWLRDFYWAVPAPKA